MIGSKQYRRRYVRPKDPRTLAQLRSRGRLSAASSLYSQALTDEQQDACIAARARVRASPPGSVRLSDRPPILGSQGRQTPEGAK